MLGSNIVLVMALAAYLDIIIVMNGGGLMSIRLLNRGLLLISLLYILEILEGFKDSGDGQSVHVVNCFSDSDCGQGRKCYKPGSWNTWHCGAQPACNSNSDCGSDGWAGTPECNGNNVQQEYKINYCNDPGTEGAYCSFSTDTRVKLTCSSGQYCSSGGCVAAECNANSDCGSDGFTNTGYCKEGDVYRDYSVHACSNPGGAQASCS